MKPVLNAIQQLLRFKDTTTIAEIARTAGLKQASVLEVINRNGHYVKRFRNNGKITKLLHRQELCDQLWKAGKFFRRGKGDYGSDKTLVFEGHEELRKRLERPGYYGGFGDSYTVMRVQDTPENEQALRAAGMVDSTEVALDDSLWKEEDDGKNSTP